MLQPGRHASSNEYRYGFQGQEKDDEVKGSGNSINYKYRMHDARIGRFFATDPLEADFPHNSPFAFAENRLIDAIELEGLENIKINYSSRTMQDLMRIYITNEGKTKINALNDKELSKKIFYGDYNIERVSLAQSSSYEASSNTIRYGKGMSWFVALAEKASFSSYVILGHEIKHAYDELFQINGVVLNKNEYVPAVRKEIELSAVKFGNYLRSVYGSEWLRDEYSGLFNNLNTDGSNKRNESIINFHLIEGWETFSNDLGDTFFKNMEVGKYYSASYEKSIDNGDYEKNWIVSWLDDEGNTNFKNFDNEDDYNSFIESNESDKN